MLNRTRRRLGIKPKRLAAGLWQGSSSAGSSASGSSAYPGPEYEQRAEGVVWSTRRVPPRRHPANSEDARQLPRAKSSKYDAEDTSRRPSHDGVGRGICRRSVYRMTDDAAI